MDSDRKILTSELTGYPSIDRPWMKFYQKEAVNLSIPSESMYYLLKNSNERRLNNTVITYLGNKIKFSSVLREISKISSALINMGIKKGDVILVYSLNTPETIELIYAINSIGAIIDFINPSQSIDEIKVESKEVDAKALFILDVFEENISGHIFEFPVIVLSLKSSAGLLPKILLGLRSKKSLHTSMRVLVRNAGENSDFLNDENLPAVILHTSGTTGTPKLAVLSNRNLNSIAVQMQQNGKDYSPNDVFLDMLPPFISFGIGMLHFSLCSGMNAVILLKPSIKGVAQMFKKYKPNRFLLGPAVIELIEDCPNKDLSHLTDISAGGAPISLQKEQEINDILMKKNCQSYYLSGYGMTEMSSVVSLNHNEHRKIQSAGIPLPLINVRIVDVDTGSEKKIGEEGELTLSGPGLMTGYLHNQNETDKTITTDENGIRWIHTGDLAKVDEDGFIFITGRIKRIFTTKYGADIYKIYTNLIEDTVGGLPEVEQCGVICAKHPIRQNVPIIFVKPFKTTDDLKLQQDIKDIVATNLPKYYEPDRIMVVDEMPITSSQKIDYRKLSEML